MYIICIVGCQTTKQRTSEYNLPINIIPNSISTVHTLVADPGPYSMLLICNSLYDYHLASSQLYFNIVFDKINKYFRTE